MGRAEEMRRRDKGGGDRTGERKGRGTTGQGREGEETGR